MFLQQFVQAPPDFVSIAVGPSIFAYQAVEPGFINVSGGTITDINLRRGNKVITAVGAIFIPVSINDIVTVNYSVKPLMTFIPILGVATK
jgi:hypothetical protein